jgi:Domain of unknown function (DUF4129)
VRVRLAAAVALGCLAAGTATVPVAAAPAAVDYVAALRAARADLAAGSITAARADLDTAARLSPGTGLGPVLADLDSNPPQVTDAEVRLDAAIGALALPPGAAAGDDAAAGASLRDVYARPEFRDLNRTTGDSGLLGLLDRFINWVGDHGPGVPGPGSVVLLLIGAAVIALFVYRLLRGVSAGRRVEVAEEPAAAGDDPDREWALAEAAAARGDHREAIRRAFRSALLAVTLRGRLPVNAAWTTRELLDVAAGDADLIAALAPAAAAFDRAWYSPAPVTEADWTVERDRCAALRTLAGRRTALR